MEIRPDITAYVASLCDAAKAASPSMAASSAVTRNSVLTDLAARLEAASDAIIEANRLDLACDSVPEKMRDRLMLDGRRIGGVAASLRELASLPDILGSGTRTVRPNGLIISKIRVPLGVVGIIYEARPNVTVDAASLCIKTGNSVVLRGGKEAINTNRVLAGMIRASLVSASLPADAVSLIDDTTREGTAALMKMNGKLDVLIPRGGAGLIRSVVENSTVPVIETGSGNCHIYIDADADIGTAVKVAVNAKMSRPSVCNAVETMLVHRAVAADFLPLFEKAAGPGLEIRADNDAAQYLKKCVPVSEDDWKTEYNDYILAVGIVDGIGEAIAHINRYGTGHSEAIITRSLDNAAEFRASVDAAAVYVNASTRFTDGGEFGLGAEIGISTQKLHARGPMGLEALTTVKYLIDGDGQIR